MDNICHTLAGAALGEAGLKRRSGLSMATLMIGANLPDIDVVTVITGGSLALRRGMTHGVVALALLPLVLVAMMLAWDRWVRRRGGRSPEHPVRPRQLILLAYVAVLSHPFLDWLNTYGIRLLMPFDDRWFYGDSLFIVDPVMWIVLGLGVYFARRISNRRPAQIALGLVTFYLVGMIGSAAAGRGIVRQAMAAEGMTGEAAVMVGPVPVNPFRRQVVIAEGDRYHFGSLRWLPRPELELAPESLPRNDHHPLARSAAATREGREFLVWSRFPFYVISEGEGGATVRIDDARYTTGSTSSFAATVVFLEASLAEDEPQGTPEER